jgi:hypothetical protein
MRAMARFTALLQERHTARCSSSCACSIKSCTRLIGDNAVHKDPSPVQAGTERSFSYILHPYQSVGVEHGAERFFRHLTRKTAAPLGVFWDLEHLIIAVGHAIDDHNEVEPSDILEKSIGLAGR